MQADGIERACAGKNTGTCSHEYRSVDIPDRKEKSAAPVTVQTGQKMAPSCRTDGLPTRVAGHNQEAGCHHAGRDGEGCTILPDKYLQMGFCT